eukprot:TRINITY_DN14795_c0_g1_i2.p1 TRINITY_DN14795_c0_g1~~TRINITY_DN14795_c0_g1_i2.p1  ORF type:complete len:166 (-),score=33.56 TRINITY_DN14795_c0_g1_i2:103-600(-)
MQSLELAREKAREAGTETVGAPLIDLPTFVQLTRIKQTRQESEEESAFDKLLNELDFSMFEADQFRQIFSQWTTFLNEGATAGAAMAIVKRDTLTKDQVVRMVRFLGISLLQGRMIVLLKALEPLLCLDKTLDFPNFLRLMRWMIDTNFGGIAKTSTSAPAAAKS